MEIEAEVDKADYDLPERCDEFELLLFRPVAVGQEMAVFLGIEGERGRREGCGLVRGWCLGHAFGPL